MTGPANRRDLVILAADQDIEFALRGLLSRPAALGMRTVDYEIYPHPEHDPGCLLRAHDFLRSFMNQFDKSLVVFDRSGSGQERKSREVLESDVERLLSGSGWATRTAAIAIDPELEVWVWSDAPEVDQLLGWAQRTPPLRSWLREKHRLEADELKPKDPKEAYEQALRAVSLPKSPSIFRKLAESVSVRRCSDPSFKKLRAVLRKWFPAK